ncbi:MAG: DUF2145 domain-containing protein [Curvibacter sp.]
MRLPLASVLLAFLCLPGPAHAGSLRYCDPQRSMGPEGLERMLRVADVVKAELQASGQPVALVSRSGLALGLLGQRYSHAGVSRRDHEASPWAVRQLYYACEEERPRIFDQGMTGFVMGVHNDAEGYLSLLTLPDEASQQLHAAVRDPQRALALLADDYSANAYPYALRYQNCNQWLVELLASAWDPSPAAPSRARAQAWLQAQGYAPTELQLWRPVLAFGRLLSYLHFDDHPPALLDQGRLQLSLPPDIEQFARQRWPEAQRVEICYTTTRVVVRRGWESLAEGCVPREGDTVLALNPPTSDLPAY